MYLDPTVSILTIHVKLLLLHREAIREPGQNDWQYPDSDICIQISFTFMLQTRFLNVLYNNVVNCYDHAVSVTDE